MKFSQTFVTYHGCGTCYIDGTNVLEGTTTKCFFPIHNPFWKEPCDTSNRIAYSTRNQLPQEATAKSILNTVKDTKKVIIIFSVIGQIVQKMNLQTIQTQTMNQTIQATQTNQKTQTTNFPYTRSKKKIPFR